jgi:hypothetical protein
MTGLYVYGITARPVRTSRPGIFGRPLRAIGVGPVHVLVETAGSAPTPTVRNLVAQHRVLQTLVSQGVDVLPVRFGTFLSGREELRRLIEARRGDLVRALGIIRGRVQMTIRLTLAAHEPQSHATTATRGATYLRARADRARRRARDPVVQAIQRAARPYARKSRLDWREGGQEVAILHHLVARGRVPQYEQAVIRVVRARGLGAIVSGPWPPFAFAEVD